MSDDLVKRLLNADLDAVKWAAAEIERLRAEVADVQGGYMHASNALLREIARANDLEAALAEARDAIDQALDDMRDGHCVAPITKDLLRAALARIGETDAIWQRGFATGKHEAAAEIERLRAAVHELEEAVNASEAALAEARDAMFDAREGWRYIRTHHGDLYGVGWDRVQTKLDAALTCG